MKTGLEVIGIIIFAIVAMGFIDMWLKEYYDEDSDL